jgi:hypothetical protein
MMHLKRAANERRDVVCKGLESSGTNPTIIQDYGGVR